MIAAAIKSLATWTIAAGISFGIVFIVVSLHARESNVNCMDNRCHVDMDRRIAALEAEMRVRTANRYTAQDAERDLRILHGRLDALQKHMDEVH